MKKIIYLTILILVLFTGCIAEIETPVYVHNKTPLLETYDSNAKFEFGKLYNKNNTVCVVKWNVCIPKNEFITLVEYMQDTKSDLDKHKSQIESYNKWSMEQNKR